MIRLTDRAKRQTLAELCGNQKQVEKAGAFFVICADTRRHRLITERADAPYNAALEAFMVAVIDASLFAQNVVVAFESLGYGICYIGALRNQLPAVDELLSIPHGVYPLFGLCVGMEQRSEAGASDPIIDTIPRPRLPKQAVSFDNRYPSDAEVLGFIDQYNVQYASYLEARGATPRGWSDAIGTKFTNVSRPDLATYYQSKGACLE